MKIGNVTLPGKVFLAPMAGVTDQAFRELCVHFGASYVITEMVSSKALQFQDRKSRELMALSDAERPAGIQIFGSEPETMALAARKCMEFAPDIIDINMGCPVGKIAGNGEGSALMRDPELAARIIEAVVKSVSVPVTVKIRKGWDKGHVNAVSFAQMAEQAGASAIAVHGRTKTQMYAGVADWDCITAVKRAVSIPVLANGDVFSGKDAEHILRYTGADMAMIGRGTFGNPWIFAQANAVLRGEPGPPLPPLAVRVDTAIRQFEMAAEYKSEKIACLEARRHFAWYLKGVPHSGYFKNQVVHIETLDDARKIAAQIKRELR